MKKLVGISIILFLLTQVTGCVIETYHYEPIDSTIRIYPPPPVHAYRIPVYGRSYYYYDYSRPIIVRKPQRRTTNATKPRTRSHGIRNQQGVRRNEVRRSTTKRHIAKDNNKGSNGGRLRLRSRVRREKRSDKTCK